MKKMKKVTILFIAFLMLFSTNVFAVDYDLYVAGVQVSDENRNDITSALVAAGKDASGTITYDPASNTLTLDNASINQSSIYNAIPNLTINLTGENTITAESDGIKSEGVDFRITGSGSLTINAGVIGIYHYECNLTIENTSVTAIGTSFGIRGYNGNNEVLTITNSTVRAKGTNTASIGNINSLVLNGCAIVQPTGATFNASQHAVYHNGTLVKTEVVIAPVYDLDVAGVQVTSANKGDISSAINQLGNSNISASGAITYDPESNTLTLDNANIKMQTDWDNIVIYNRISNFTINLIGENSIKTAYGICSYFADFTITGPGSLTIDAEYGIYPCQCNLTIENTTVIVTTVMDGIYGYHGDNEVLTINNSTVRAFGHHVSINDINNLVLNGCEIIQPAGAAFDASKKAVCLNGERVKTEVVIGSNYDLYVAGVQVTGQNRDDITSAVVAAGHTASGNITYDPESNTLTLDNATINATATDINGISNGIAGLSIHLIGENTITASDDGIYSNQADFTITGNGSLTVNANNGIYLEECNLNIENTTVTANGNVYGIAGNNGSTEVLTIFFSNVKATGTSTASIANINNLVLNACAITQPAGALFDASQKAVCLNGTIVTTEVVIAPTYDLYVADVQVNSLNKDDITSTVVAAGHTASGNITYDPAANTLTLDNATINVTATDINGISNEIAGLSIHLIGENTITASDEGIYSNQADFTITGNGSLTVNANNGIYLEECNLNIENTTVTANGNVYGIAGNDGSTEVLTIFFSNIKATGTSTASIANINNLVINACEITQPEDAVFEVSQKAVCVNGEIVTTEVEIKPIIYDLKIVGIQVNDVNKDDILGDGKVSYDPESNTLTLDNANISTSGFAVMCIENHISNLTINLAGENTITIENIQAGILSSADFTITGSGSLSILGGIDGNFGILFGNGTLTIENTTVAAYSWRNGIAGDNSHTGSLIINNSTVRARGEFYGGIIEITNLILNGCAITQPSGAYFDAEQYAVVDANGELVMSEIVIEPIIYYDLYVAGVQVTNLNKDDIASAVNNSGNGTASGSIIYSPSINFLILDNATINATANNVNGISNEIANIEIVLLGENTITANGKGIESDQADFKIRGNSSSLGAEANGSLTINANNGIYLEECNLTIENTTVTVNGQDYGICGEDSSTEVLTINNSTVKATGTNQGSIANIGNLVLSNDTISQPTNAAFDASQKGVCLNGELVKTEVIIEAMLYELWVGYGRATYANKDNLTGSGIISGSASYDPTTKTLTLDNVSINVTMNPPLFLPHSNGIFNRGIPNLTINLIGENTINANGGAGIYSNENFTITGNGSLTVNGSNGIEYDNCNVTIENTMVTLNGNHYGIWGYNNSISEVLTITNSTVRATGTNYGSIEGMSNLILNGCAITEPTGAVFNASQNAVCLNGEKVKTAVVIEPIIHDLWVAGVRVIGVNQDDISTALNQLGNPNISASGNITYDPTNNTLTLDNATLNVTNNTVDGISNQIANLTINLIGENTITTNYRGICSNQADFSITGTGSLTINSNYIGIYSNGCNLTINNTIVTANGNVYGIAGNDGYTEVLSITNSFVSATGTNLGSIAFINNLVLNNGSIFQPTNAEFDASQKGVCLNGELVTTEVVIEPIDYNLWIADVKVNYFNRNDITAAINQLGETDVSASGTITYDPITKTLTLDNATINKATITITSNYAGIHNEISDLTINLVGNNAIITEDRGIYSGKSFKITGAGTLTINAKNCIFVDYFLTIENTTVTAIGRIYGIVAARYTINNSTVRATTTEAPVNSVFWGLIGASIGLRQNDGLVLNGCEIVQPLGAYVGEGNENGYAICLNGEIIYSEVIIAPFPTISVSDATACDSYTLPTSETSDTWIWTNESNETVTEAIESGVYTVVATSEFDLTATESITVIINQSVTNEITEVACGSFEWNGTTYDASGDYSETFTAENGCDSIVTLHLTINELPTVEIVQEGEILTATAGMETYAWNTNETTETITISATGNYSVTVTNSEGCESTADIEVTEIPTTGINEIAVSKIAVYPNPNNGEFTINLSGIDNAISYQVIDAKGAIVKEAKVNSNEEFVSIEAKAGNYTVKVITDSKVFLEQIIVQ